MAGSKVLSASGVEEAAHLVTESVIRASLFKVVYEKICEEENAEATETSPVTLQAEQTVREVLLRSLAQYLSGQGMQFIVKKKAVMISGEDKERMNAHCESQFAIELFHGAQPDSLASVETSGFDFRRTWPHQNQNHCRDHKDTESNRFIAAAQYQSDIANEKLIMKNLKETVKNDKTNSIDLSVIESFRSIVGHAGYFRDLKGGGRRTSIIAIYGCQLPPGSTEHYDQIMNSLLVYISQRIESASPDDYVIVYIHGGSSKSRIPTFKWIRQAYVTINQKLKKNLKMFFIVHPSILLRTTLFFCKPLLSLSFKSKLFIVPSLTGLKEFIPTENIILPDCAKLHEECSK